MTDAILQDIAETEAKIEAGYRNAQLNLATNPDDPKCADDVRHWRDRWEQVKDRRAGREEQLRLEAKEQQKRKCAAERQALEKACATSVKQLDELKRIAERIPNHIKSLADDIAAYDDCRADILRTVPKSVRDQVHTLLCGSFRSLEELISAELFAAGLVIQGMDHLGARTMIEQLGFADWMNIRDNEARSLIVHILDNLGDET